MIASALKRLFTPDPVKLAAHDAYLRAVAQARKEIFYKEWQVNDTVDGRFDIILLHIFLIASRCEAQKSQPEVEGFLRALAEVFFSDMDRSLREMGSTDTGVGIRVKKMAEAFYGRLKAYEQAGAYDAAMKEALRRNVYREKEIPDQAVDGLASYMKRNRETLQLQPVDALVKGRVVYSD